MENSGIEENILQKELKKIDRYTEKRERVQLDRHWISMSERESEQDERPTNKETK